MLKRSFPWKENILIIYSWKCLLQNKPGLIKKNSVILPLLLRLLYKKNNPIQIFIGKNGKEFCPLMDAMIACCKGVGCDWSRPRFYSLHHSPHRLCRNKKKIQKSYLYFIWKIWFLYVIIPGIYCIYIL